MYHCTTSSGKKIDFLAPNPAMISLNDIAAGLARLCHFAGQSSWDKLYSVAEHTVNGTLQFLKVAEARSDPMESERLMRLALLFLIYPAPMAYTGVLSPNLKTLIPNLLLVEKRLERVIYRRLRVTPPSLEECAVLVKHKQDVLRQEHLQLKTRQKLPTLRFYSIKAAEAKWLSLFWELYTPNRGANQLVLAV